MNKTFFLYGISAISLLALAGIYPKIATMFIGLLILGVLVEHGDEYATLLNAAQGKSKK